MGRAPCCDKARVKKGPWAPEEDAVLKAYLDAHGTGGNWIALPNKIGLNRCGKSCRLRWLNYLRPNIRHGGFTDEEDRLICTLYISIGSRWSTIAAQLPGRTDNDVKNYWNTKLKRRLLGGGRRPVRYDCAPHSPRLLPSPAGGAATSALERMQLSVQLQRRHGRLLQVAPGGFTFYGNLSAPPWAARQPLSPAASGNSEMQLQPQRRVLSGGTATGYSGFWSHVQAASSTYTGGVGVQDQGTWDWDSTGGGTPPLSTSTTCETAAGIESSGSTPTASSATLGGGDMEDAIGMLLQQIGGFGENDGQVGGEAVVDGDAGSWSSCSTPGVDSVFQDYVQGFM